jgi:hypothetical protein
VIPQRFKCFFEPDQNRLYHPLVTLLKKTFPSGAGFWLFFRKGEITLGRYADVRFQLCDGAGSILLDQPFKN